MESCNTWVWCQNISLKLEKIDKTTFFFFFAQPSKNTGLKNAVIFIIPNGYYYIFLLYLHVNVNLWVQWEFRQFKPCLNLFPRRSIFITVNVYTKWGNPDIIWKHLLQLTDKFDFTYSYFMLMWIFVLSVWRSKWDLKWPNGICSTMNNYLTYIKLHSCNCNHHITAAKHSSISFFTCEWKFQMSATLKMWHLETKTYVITVKLTVAYYWNYHQNKQLTD